MAVKVVALVKRLFPVPCEEIQTILPVLHLEIRWLSRVTDLCRLIDLEVVKFLQELLFSASCLWSGFHLCLILSDMFYSLDGLNTLSLRYKYSRIQLLRTPTGFIKKDDTSKGLLEVT